MGKMVVTPSRIADVAKKKERELTATLGRVGLPLGARPGQQGIVVILLDFNDKV